MKECDVFKDKCCPVYNFPWPDMALEKVTVFPSFRMPVHFPFQKFGDKEKIHVVHYLLRSNNDFPFLKKILFFMVLEANIVLL